MTKLKIPAFISFLTFVFLLTAAQNPTSKPATHRPLTPQAKGQSDKDAAAKPALPTTAEVDAYMKRSFGYDPGVNWEVLAIRQSTVPGIAEIIVSVNKGDPYHLFYSSVAQIAFV